ncbi:hypothetical protein F442_05944 [Phytophthora nicotianae P10297]|uniref:Uncharacterized protein n=1 Tax=Phytophthora nicotianae P10297 TaxID=1317064 RepID=W2ZPZ4_PHYNI|nr:hypothetical protein F442_05944 [Phytophthora nicotianae P10297]
MLSTRRRISPRSISTSGGILAFQRTLVLSAPPPLLMPPWCPSPWWGGSGLYQRGTAPDETALLNGVTTRSSAAATTSVMPTRAATRAAQGRAQSPHHGQLPPGATGPVAQSVAN